MDLSCVYSTLDRLRDLQILSQTDLGRGCAEYEIVTDEPEHHLRCRCCVRVTEPSDAYLKTMGERVGLWVSGYS